MRRIFGLLLVMVLLVAGCAHPPSKPPFAVDGPRAAVINERVLQVGYPKRSTIKDVTSALVKGLQDDHERMYAIYRWVSQNIEYDVQAYLTGNLLSTSGALHTFKTGVAVCDGFSDLVLEMGAHAGLEVAKVEGLAKGFGLVVTADSSQKPNHAWNAVKLDGSWHLMDATWDSGGVDATTRKFVRNTGVPSYFMADPKGFASTHFPVDARWQLLKTRVDFKTFAGATQLVPRVREMGLDVSAHTQEDVRSETGLYRFHFGPHVQRLQAGLQQAGKAIEGNWSLLMWGPDGRPDLLVSAPVPGNYKVAIFGANDPQATVLAPLLNYNLQLGTAGALNGGFPLAYADYYVKKTQLLEPLSGYLPAGHPVRFKFKAGDAQKAALFQNGVYLKEADAVDGWFVADAIPAPGQLSVGVMGANDTVYRMLLGYQAAKK